MYKPPENANRVRAMKMKFEPQDVSKPKNLPDTSKVLKDISLRRENTTVDSVAKAKPQILNRQLSDPSKCNIKRTPAFRLDKNAFIEKEHIFKRSSSQEEHSKINRPKPTEDDSSRLKENCDNTNKNGSSKCASNKMVNDIKNKLYSIRDDCKSARERNCDIKVQTNQLYTEPIPKSVRLKKSCDTDLHTQETLRIETKHKLEPIQMCDNDLVTSLNTLNSKIETAQNVITILQDQQINGSDTIKNALKRPLPAGPAPRKPPRTFQHSPQSKSKTDTLPVSKSDPNLILKLDKEFTNHLNSKMEKNQVLIEQKTKRDPRYMLERLESALKNNKAKLQRHAKIEYNSEEEDNVKNTSKSLCSSPMFKRHNSSSISLSPNQMFGRCLPSLGCSKNTYARIKEPSSSFFVDDPEEPVYAEPYQYTPDVITNDGEDSKENNGGGMRKNSLYYMSNPVLGLDVDVVDGEDMERQVNAVKEMVNQCETSSLSTLSSDTESNASTPLPTNEGSFALVKDLIKSFETKSSSSDNVDDKPNGIASKHTKRTNDGRRYGVIDTGTAATTKTVERRRKDTKKFEIYVTTVRAFSIRKMSNDNLFHCCLLVGLDGKSPYIKSKFPANVQIPAYIEKLCFPDSDDHRVSYGAKEQCYSLVITDASGERIYGYCRRVLPEGSCCCLPLAYCVLTKNRAPRFYKRILEKLETHHGLPDRQRDALINAFYKLKFPKPGQSIKLDLGKIIHNDVRYYGTEASNQNNNQPNRDSNEDILRDFCLVSTTCPHGFVKDSCDPSNRDACQSCRAESASELVLMLHQDTRYEETDLKELCDTLDVVTLQKVFENLLLERKVIFTCSQLSKLSSCIEAIQSVLYPFSWPHAFIPVLPKSRWEIVEAPAPLICGVLSSAVVNEYKIENGIVVDLDTKQILLQVDDEEKILPMSALKYWKKGLNMASSIKTADNEQNVLLSDAFIRVFILTCGHYKDFITNGVFDKQGFKNFPTSKGVKRFLQWFTLTTMFDLFIEAALANPNSFYIFDSRIKIYSSQDATLILEKMRDWTNNIKF